MSAGRQADPQSYREAMRRTAASVAVITAAHEGRIHGMTATAMTSVSADPPTLLVVVSRATRTHPFIRKSGRFAVNVLARGQEEIARRFAAGIENQFDGVAHELHAAEVPIIAGTAAAFVCIATEAFDVATHTIFIGAVEEAHHTELPPLVYHDGSYHALG
ncbi:MAG TPA: flavin reductase family protein [Candidatus Dormibacteraeota bacterium]|nr:flavin reductase family protein [Candidatus Dormibacteraeota bacterium]